jgi:hypothetical protein
VVQGCLAEICDVDVAVWIKQLDKAGYKKKLSTVNKGIREMEITTKYAG